MKNFLFCLALALGTLPVFAVAEDGHDKSHAHERYDDHAEHGEHESPGENEEDGKHDGHEEHKGHDEREGHGQVEGHETHGEEAHEDEDEHGHGAAANLGEGKAVEEYHEEKGRIRLGAKAVKRLGLRWARPQGRDGAWFLPETAIVSVRGESFVYLTEGERWFWSKKIRATEAGGDKVRVESLESSAQVVVAGANFIRLSELDMQAGESVGHGH